MEAGFEQLFLCVTFVVCGVSDLCERRWFSGKLSRCQRDRCPGFDSRTAHVVTPPLFLMGSDPSSGLFFSLLDHANGIYACLRTLINDRERTQGYFGKSAVEPHLCICGTELDSQNPEIDMLDQTEWNDGGML